METVNTAVINTSEAGATSIPHNREAEEAVLGSLFIGGEEIYHQIRIFLPAGAFEFYIHRHRWIWEAATRLIEARQPIDMMTMAEELDRKGILSEAGGPAFLTTLAGQVPSFLNAPNYAQIVHSHFIRRQMLDGANETARFAYDETLPIEEATAKAIKALTDRVAYTAQGRIKDLQSVLLSTADLVEANGKSKYLPGIQTSLIDLDELLGGGWQKSDLIMVSTRPGGGKTSLILQCARHAALYTAEQKVFRHNALIFSAEMPAEQLVMRLISQMSGVDYQIIRRGRMDEKDNLAYLEAIQELERLNLSIDDTPSPTVDYIDSRCEVLASEGKLDIVFVDYLQLVKSGMQFKKTVEEIDYIARRLKVIARTHNVPVIVAHQMNRNQEHRSEDSRPQLPDLNEGGEKDPDVILFIWNKTDESGSITDTKLVIAKHRNGPTGDVDVVFRRQFTRFENAALRRFQ